MTVRDRPEIPKGIMCQWSENNRIYPIILNRTIKALFQAASWTPSCPLLFPFRSTGPLHIKDPCQAQEGRDAILINRFVLRPAENRLIPQTIQGYVLGDQT